MLIKSDNFRHTLPYDSWFPGQHPSQVFGTKVGWHGFSDFMLATGDHPLPLLAFHVKILTCDLWELWLCKTVFINFYNETWIKISITWIRQLVDSTLFFLWIFFQKSQTHNFCRKQIEMRSTKGYIRLPFIWNFVAGCITLKQK